MSHFSIIKTQLRKKEHLLAALRDLGMVAEAEEKLVRGYRGQTVKADLAVSVNKGSDIGFRWNSSTDSYELVADLDLWSQPVPVERFLSKLTQQYALNTVLSATAEEGFAVEKQANNLDGSIELVVTRWD
ncbi:DUF1257 domain-containing protein [Prochlorococcus sp. MIT 1341]|uniref:DUF1257 domain-containing protein n=1 Tax=Prochlorococcus sp. MIT 1341 TaxID=3096221 RepID=UPI002A75011B|nr:DUF1257 domain-containing protein [Prochlorococcus sp. MIT 1341]